MGRLPPGLELRMRSAHQVSSPIFGQSRWAACRLRISSVNSGFQISVRFPRPSLVVAVGRRPPGLERLYLRVGCAPAHQVTSPILVKGNPKYTISLSRR